MGRSDCFWVFSVGSLFLCHPSVSSTLLAQALYRGPADVPLAPLAHTPPSLLLLVVLVRPFDSHLPCGCRPCLAGIGSPSCQYLRDSVCGPERAELKRDAASDVLHALDECSTRSQAAGLGALLGLDRLSVLA